MLKRFEAADRKALKVELDVEPDAEEYIVTKDAAAFGEGWSGYKSEAFGVKLGRFSNLSFEPLNNTLSS